MNRSIIALALALASIGTANAVEDLTIRNDRGNMTMTVHAAGIQAFINEHDDMQVVAYVSMVKNRTITRDRIAVSGCDKEGGRFALVDQKTGKLGEQMVWFWTGTSMMDGVAQRACLIATEKVLSQQSKKAGYNL